MNRHTSQHEILRVMHWCVYNGETDYTFVDTPQGTDQKYIEDCQVCCQPNELQVSYNEWEKEHLIQASLEQ